MRQDLHLEPIKKIVRHLWVEMLRDAPHSLRGEDLRTRGNEIQGVYQQTFQSDDKRPAEKKRIDSLSRQRADVASAHVKAHASVDEKEHERNRGHKHSALAASVKVKGDQIKLKERKEQENENALTKTAPHAYPKKTERSFQGQKFDGDILAFTFDHIELLDLGNCVDDVFRLPFASA